LVARLPLSEQRAIIGPSANAEKDDRGNSDAPLDVRAAQVATIRMLMNLDEFVTRQ
jgi:hypothetical protein